MIDHKNIKNPSSNKMTIIIQVQGKDAPIIGTPDQLARFIKHLNSKKQPTAKKKKDTIPLQLVIDHIENNENFEHSTPSIMKFFLLEPRKDVHIIIDKKASKARKHLEKKYNGQFKMYKVISADYSKMTPTKNIVWSFEPTTPKD